jgi:uncharacterized membrane protein
MSRPTDHQLELSVAGMLKIGVTLSAVVVFIGALLYLRHPWQTIPSYSHFHAPDHALSSLSGVFSGVLHFQPAGIMQLGLILLIATPVARVVLCVVGFARQRDMLYVAISTAVLIILASSLAGSAR